MPGFLSILDFRELRTAHSCSRSGSETGAYPFLTQLHHLTLSLSSFFCLSISQSLFDAMVLSPMPSYYHSSLLHYTFSCTILSCPVLPCHTFLWIVEHILASNSSLICSSCLLFSIFLKVLLTGCCDSIARRAPLGSVKSGSRHRRLTGSCSSSYLFTLYSSSAYK